jgi:hypothetical protein
MKPTRVAVLFLLAFLFGSGSAEVAVQTGRALARARADRQLGTAGDLVSLELRGEDGETIAHPRLIAPIGRPAQLVLRDASDPERVRLTLRVETVREASGDIKVDYVLQMPAFEISTSGRLSVTPGVEQVVDLGGGAVSGTLLALPVPSAAFDAYVESEGLRTQPVNAI